MCVLEQKQKIWYTIYSIHSAYIYIYINGGYCVLCAVLCEAIQSDSIQCVHIFSSAYFSACICLYPYSKNELCVYCVCIHNISLPLPLPNIFIVICLFVFDFFERLKTVIFILLCVWVRLGVCVCVWGYAFICIRILYACGEWTT